MRKLRSLSTKLMAVATYHASFNKKAFFKAQTLSCIVIMVLAILVAPLFVSQSLGGEADLVSGSGAFILPIPIVVPPGRAGIQPELALTYNSYDLSSWVGAWWTLGMGNIHRPLKDGVKYEEGEYEVNGLKLIRALVWDKTGYHAYAPEVQTDYTRYFIKTDATDKEIGGWEVQTKDGKTLYFGTTDKSRQSFDSGADVFKWCLDRVEDANGNYMTISYTKYDGEIYLRQIVNGGVNARRVAV